MVVANLPLAYKKTYIRMVSDGASKLVVKPIYWMGSSRKDLRSFPKKVQSEIG